MEKVTLMAGCLSYWYKRVLRCKGWQAVRIDLFFVGSKYIAVAEMPNRPCRNKFVQKTDILP